MPHVGDPSEETYIYFASGVAEESFRSLSLRNFSLPNPIMHALDSTKRFCTVGCGPQQSPRRLGARKECAPYQLMHPFGSNICFARNASFASLNLLAAISTALLEGDSSATSNLLDFILLGILNRRLPSARHGRCASPLGKHRHDLKTIGTPEVTLAVAFHHALLGAF